MISTEIKANPNPSISVALAKKNKACIPFLSLIPPSQFAKTEKTYKQKKKAQQLCFDPSHIFKERSRLYQWGHRIWRLWG